MLTTNYLAPYQQTTPAIPCKWVSEEASMPTSSLEPLDNIELSHIPLLLQNSYGPDESATDPAAVTVALQAASPIANSATTTTDLLPVLSLLWMAGFPGSSLQGTYESNEQVGPRSSPERLLRPLKDLPDVGDMYNIRLCQTEYPKESASGVRYLARTSNCPPTSSPCGHWPYAYNCVQQIYSGLLPSSF
ncbi:hypothetical protein PHLGIDRAFT_404482 [Phlebiopsis gigantea 11061_1 CR5-6]|uniref:Uncharacterized protein n=1 Tax=Phlebiopsis gigantea (strain 11061_1 CR5-6) TaxID=745531 RepID=A0A0C3PMJ0_PHLG1|nr:hypothetical protein PHLGIDRAFT_404482 [Phlebiopsis gigantea 11061_1 CR5-6]